MLSTIGKLFGRSPFAPLQAHMEKVHTCVHRLPALLDALISGDQERLESIAREISKLEHAADLAKNDIRDHLPISLFLPVDRASLLEVLRIQDSIADQAEDAAVLLTLRSLTVLEGFADPVRDFVERNIQAFDLAHRIIQELPELLESSFGGKEAEKVRIMVDEVAEHEHRVDVVQRDLLRAVMTRDNELSTAEFFLWIRFIETISGISDRAEKLAHRIRMTLEVK